jgi:hypothetical protein
MADLRRAPAWSQDPDLAAFVASGDPGSTIAVIVEAAAPPVRIAPRTSAVPHASLPVIEPGAGRVRDLMASGHLRDIELALDRCGAGALTILPGALSVVVRLTAEQIRQIGELPAVAAMRWNRELGREKSAGSRSRGTSAV